ncbi:TIGR00725 family protein [Actinomadura syzygii]|uniref:TIGR00725 family protein n=1 Tax=Actinomadura syzygii TaxID=1427538 RepID=A0A5D0TXH5_9ACTN|nr:TIGR00725 family protein [Actinomadura syzygii]TYC10045.1 TIGR00725 family protein [Actinomadura syzygii]
MAIQVSVCGPRNCTEEDRRNAREIGRLLATRGAVVICGGYTGVMAEVAAGAATAGGTVVGILSRADREGANPDLTITIPTGVGEARNNIIVNSGDAVVVIGGSWGTLSELALAKRRGGVPVVQLGGWQILDADRQPLLGIEHAATPAEALERTGLWS